MTRGKASHGATTYTWLGSTSMLPPTSPYRWMWMDTDPLFGRAGAGSARLSWLEAGGKTALGEGHGLSTFMAWLLPKFENSWGPNSRRPPSYSAPFLAPSGSWHPTAWGTKTSWRPQGVFLVTPTPHVKTLHVIPLPVAHSPVTPLPVAPLPVAPLPSTPTPLGATFL